MTGNVENSGTGSESEASNPVVAIWMNMHERAQQGQRVRVEDFLKPTEPLWNDPERILDLAYAEVLLRVEAGETPNFDELAQRFPSIAEKLSRQLAIHDALESTRHEERSTLTKGLPPSAENSTLMPPPSTRLKSAEPTSIGKYRVIACLGQGGQATVYRGFDSELNRDVLIKIGHEPLVNDQELSIRTEGRTLASLRHAALPVVLDFDLFENRPFIVTEFVEGRSLERVAAEAPVSPERAAQLVQEIARVVASAHGQGVLHLDLKPGNILLGRDDRIRVIDFGLARLFAAESQGDQRLGNVSGTLPYMPPEQASGEAARLSLRCDVFGLGGILYFLLTGRAPYRMGSGYEIYSRILQGKWDREPLANPRIPPSLRRACEKALAPKPEDRFATATDFAEALGSRRSPWKLRAAALAIGLLFCVGAAIWIGRSQDQRPVNTEVVAIPQPGLHVKVFDAERQRYRDLVYMLPAATGERVRIEAERPKGCYVDLFAIDADGSVRSLASWTPQDDLPGLTYPANPSEAVALTPPTGTMVLVLCGRIQKRVSVEEIRSAAGTSAWPKLPPRSLLRLTRDKVTAEGDRGLGTPEATVDREGEVSRRLETLRLTVRCDALAAVAFAHE